MSTLVRHERPRELRWYLAGPMFFGDLGTSRLYVLGLAVYFAGTAAPYYVAAICALVALVGWIYTIICRIYPDGGGVYTSGRLLHPMLGAIGAIMLFANYVVTAALSTYEAIVYIGAPFGLTQLREEIPWLVPLLTVGAFGLIAAINYVGSKRAATFALIVAIASIGITALLAAATITHVPEGWATFTSTSHDVGLQRTWINFVAVVLALSGVESIANMTGIMTEPVGKTARRAIWPVIVEVVLLNMLLIFVVCSVPEVQQAGVIVDEVAARGETHLSESDRAIKEHVLEVAARHYIGPIFATAAAIVFGLLLLSATNTAVIGMISIQYGMSRNRELPAAFGALNGFGVPFVSLATGILVPVVVALVFPSLEMLAKLYAIGVVGAIVINLACAAYNRKLPIKSWERIAMWIIATMLTSIWLTIAITNQAALLFIVVMLAGGLGLRFIATQVPRPAATADTVTPEATSSAELRALKPFDPAKPRLLVASRGNVGLLNFAFEEAARRDANLFLLFVRDLAVMFPGTDQQLTPDEDREATELFERATQQAREQQTPLQTIYAVSRDPADVILDFSATYAVDVVLMGVSRRGGMVRALRGDVMNEVANHLPAETTLLIHA